LLHRLHEALDRRLLEALAFAAGLFARGNVGRCGGGGDAGEKENGCEEAFHGPRSQCFSVASARYTTPHRNDIGLATPSHRFVSARARPPRTITAGSSPPSDRNGLPAHSVARAR